mgnify:FL=1
MICQDLISRKGIDSKYAKDCLVRAIRGVPYAEATALIGWTGPPPIVIQAGIGTLVLGPDSEEFTPAPSLGQKVLGVVAALASPGFATDEETERRQAICAACPQWNAERGLCTACGCHTAAKTRLASQVCPKSMW